MYYKRWPLEKPSYPVAACNDDLMKSNKPYYCPLTIPAYLFGCLMGSGEYVIVKDTECNCSTLTLLGLVIIHPSLSLFSSCVVFVFSITLTSMDMHDVNILLQH